MEASETPQPARKPSLVTGSIFLAAVCIGVFVYNVLRSDSGGGTSYPGASYAIGEGIGGGLFIWVIFHFVIAKRRGWGFSGLSLALILVLSTVGTLVNVRAKDHREQMARMGASMKKEMESIASAAKEGKPTAKIDITPAAQGDVGEMERFGRVFLSKMAEQRNEYLRQLQGIGWDKVLDAQRIAADKNMAQSKAMVQKARPLVASYRDKAFATIESARADIDKLQVSDAAKAGFRKGFEKSLETSRGRLTEQLALEAGIVDEVGKLFDLLAAKKGTWALQNGKLAFSDRATLASFNGHIGEIRKMSARQEALQEQALESTRAKLDNMGK